MVCQDHFILYILGTGPGGPTAIKAPQKIAEPFVAIGDVHGQIDLLEGLLAAVERGTPGFDDHWIVFVGDLVDRGEDPKGAVSLVLRLIKARGKTTSIMGNHELVLLCSLGMYGPAQERRWADMYAGEFSSAATFRSYGAEPGDFRALKRRVPDEHLELLLSLPWFAETAGHLVVHAGLSPDEPFAGQRAGLEARDTDGAGWPWLDDPRLVSSPPPPDCPFTVVSGHVRQPRVVFAEKRILTDTSGGLGGPLSAVRLPDRTVFVYP